MRHGLTHWQRVTYRCQWRLAARHTISWRATKFTLAARSCHRGAQGNRLGRQHHYQRRAGPNAMAGVKAKRPIAPSGPKSDFCCSLYVTSWPNADVTQQRKSRRSPLEISGLSWLRGPATNFAERHLSYRAPGGYGGTPLSRRAGPSGPTGHAAAITISGKLNDHLHYSHTVAVRPSGDQSRARLRCGASQNACTNLHCGTMLACVIDGIATNPYTIYSNHGSCHGMVHQEAGVDA